MISDPLTLAGTALTTLLGQETLLAPYNWQPYESNVPAEGPRGYVNVNAQSALNEAYLPERLEFEIVFEGAPKTLTSAEAVAIALSHVTRWDISDALTALITDGSVTFVGRAEDLRLTQSIVGQIRQYKVGFVLFISWNVAHT